MIVSTIEMLTQVPIVIVSFISHIRTAEGIRTSGKRR